MKNTLLIVGLFIATIGISQSNDVRRIHLKAGLGFGSCSGTLSTKNSTTDITGMGSFFGVKAEYGIAKILSAGIYIRSNYAKTELNSEILEYEFSKDDHLNIMVAEIGVSASIYAINKDRFNVYVSPSFGYAPSLISSFQFFGHFINGSASGIIYGLSAGVNVYFGNVVGMYLDLGYQAESLSLKERESFFSSSSDNSFSGDVSLTNIGASLGVVFNLHK